MLRSGDEFELVTVAEIPTLFNSEANNPAEFNKRSDNKGPEPEGIALVAVADSPASPLASRRSPEKPACR